jgi:mono/diheme cytochrome c family protein
MTALNDLWLRCRLRCSLEHHGAHSLRSATAPGQRSLIAVLGLALSLGGTVGCRGWQSEDPPVHLNWNMDTQEKGKSYRASDFFADGRAMRTPPAGTVAQGWLKDDDHFSQGIGPDGQPATSFPASFEGGEAAVRRGQQRFNIYCSPCHGQAGDGAGLVASRMLVKPPSFHDSRLKEMPVGKIFQAITHGVNNGNMGPYNAQIEERDRWNIILYVRALQKSKDPSVTLGGQAVAQAVATDPPEKQGEALYKAKGCNACHSLDGTRLVGPSWKGIYGKTEKTDKGDVVVDDAYLKESMQQPNAKITGGDPPYPPVMPPLPLTDDDIANLIAFIKTVK